jgi:molybdopterin synthase catalytic subunit
MKIEIRSETFNPWMEIQHYQQSQFLRAGQYGATAVFVGTMRDFNEGERVHSMYLEHYAGMTEKQLQAIAAQAEQRWEILDVLIIHRSGQICLDDPIVLVAVWSAHRAAAYEANRFLMEALKSTAPFWKKEVLQDRSRWVEQNTPG